MEPPFVVGILAGFGSGKKFTLNLIRERLKEIQKYDLTNEFLEENFLYVGHIYPICFDAWTFSKGDIWTDLVCHILTCLNDQLDLEVAIGPKLLRKGVSVIELMDEFTTSGEMVTTSGEMEYLQEVMKDESCRAIREWKPRGGHITQALIYATNSNYNSDVREIAEKKEKLRKMIAYVAFKDVIADKNTSIEPEIKELIQKAYKNYAEENINDQFPQTVEDAMKSWEGNYFGSFKRYCFQFLAGSLTSLWYTLFLSSLTIVIPLVLENTYILAIAAAIACLSAVQFKHNDARKKLKSAEDEISKVEGELRLLDKKQILEKWAAANKPQGLSDSDEEKQQDNNIATLNFEINSLEDRIWLREGESLNKVVGDRLESSNYGHRGVVHQAQSDLQHISDVMLSNNSKGSFPRGDPRIVLFIDGLDRCPPPKVVETLEAVQLLLDSKLFVVVLAIDTQYVTLCLEDTYKNILVPKQHPSGNPSGMDYIEKIIQLPYRVPPISYEYMELYLQDQMNAKNMITQSNSAREELSDKSKRAKPKDNGQFPVPGQSIENTPLLSAFTGDEETLMTETAQHRPEEPLVAIPTDELDFTWEELQSLKSACVFSGVSPRSGKRLVNVFKLMKIIWYRRDQTLDEETPYEASMREACVWILALCASNSKGVRLRMCEVLGKVEQAQTMPAGCNNNLIDFIKKALGERVEGQAKDNLLTMIDDDKCSKILKEVVWNDEKEWNTTKKDLRLLRSFSFVGEYNEPVDDIHHPTQQIIAATQEKDDSVQENDSADRAVTIHRITEARETRVKFEKDLEACRHKRKEIELKYAENEKKKAKKLKPIDEEIAICKAMMKELKSTLVKYAEELNALDNDGAPERLRHESSSSSSDDSESDNDE